MIKLVAVAGFISAVGFAVAQTYRLVDIGTLGGASSSGWGINTSGHVVGYAQDATGVSYGFLWNGTTMHEVDQVVGASPTTNNFLHAYVYDGIMHDLGTLGGQTSLAYGVGASGIVVGGADTGYEGQERAFLYDGTGMHDIGTLGGPDSSARSVNGSGQATGGSNTALGYSHAFLYSGSTMNDLGTLGGHTSTGLGINGSGQVAGWSFLADNNTQHAFLYDGSSMIDLGAMGGIVSQAYGLNDLAQVVGEVELRAGVVHGFLYSNSAVQDLNNLLDSSGAGWTVEIAQGINNSGEIAATAINSAGNAHAVVLNPVRTIAGTVNLQNYMSSAIAGTPVKVEIRSPGTTTSLDTHVVPLDASGNFSFTTSLPAGAYDVAVKAPHWLRKAMYSENVGMYGVNGLNCSLINGDVNGDNVVSLADFGQLRAAFGSSSGSGNWNPNADLNGDGAVSLADFGILRANFGRQGDP
jgi:probable HAF family extracellular repeat protein